jgi:hypothetical protein
MTRISFHDLSACASVPASLFKRAVPDLKVLI